MSNRKALPNFLIIGAMKAGTTTLYRDLVDHPDIFLPQEKEPETLVRHVESDEAVIADYRSLFLPASEGQVLGEASTAYTKRPDYEGVAARALRICGRALKIVYLTREPISRMVSQYRHEAALGLVSGPLNEAIVREGRFVAYSRYDWQLAPWIEAFGKDNVLVLKFEDYIADRQSVVSEVCRFLGVSMPGGADFSRAFNTSDGKMVARGVWKRVVDSRFYQRQVKPRLPFALRERLSGMVLSPVKPDASQLEPETREQLLAELLQEPSVPANLVNEIPLKPTHHG